MKSKFVVFTGVKQIEIREEELPEALPPGAVLVKSEYTFISAGTELSNLTGKERKVHIPNQWCTYPWRPGYAQVGRIVAMAPDAQNAAIGDRVFTFGKHAAYSVVTDFWFKLPEGIDPVEAVATRMAMVAASALVAHVPSWLSPGWVAVLGLGAVGNFAAQCYRALGARVIGVDPVESRRALAQKCGIAHVVAGGDNLAKDIQAVTGGENPYIVVEATGVPKLAADAILLARGQGAVVFVGTARGPYEVNLTELMEAIHYRSLRLYGAFEWCMPHFQPAGVEPINNHHDKIKMLYDWVLDGRLKVAPLVSHVLKAEDIAQGYEGLLMNPETYTGVAVDWRHC